MLNKNIHQQPHEMPKHITSHSFEISTISQILVTQVVVLSVNRHFLSQSLFFSCRYCLNVGQYQLSDFFVENCGFQKLFAFSALCCWSRINFKFLSQNRNFNPNDKPLGNQQACSVQIQDTKRFFFVTLLHLEFSRRTLKLSPCRPMRVFQSFYIPLIGSRDTFV